MEYRKEKVTGTWYTYNVSGEFSWSYGEEDYEPRHSEIRPGLVRKQDEVWEEFNRRVVAWVERKQAE